MPINPHIRNRLSGSSRVERYNSETCSSYGRQEWHGLTLRTKRARETINHRPVTQGWLDFWEKKKGKKATQCKVMNCGGKPDLGGHVIKVGEGGKEYILLCATAATTSRKSEVFKAWDGDLVSVT